MPDDYGNKPFVKLGEVAGVDNLTLSQVEDFLDGMVEGMRIVDAEGNELGQAYESDINKITLQPFLSSLAGVEFGELTDPKSIAQNVLAKQIKSRKSSNKSANLRMARALILEALSSLEFDSDPSRVLELNWALMGKPIVGEKRQKAKRKEKAPVSMSYDMSCFDNVINGLTNTKITPRVLEEVSQKVAPIRNSSFSDHIRDIVIEAMLEAGDFESGPGLSILRVVNSHVATLIAYMELINENISFFEKEIVKIQTVTTRASGDIQRITMRFTSFLQELSKMIEAIMMSLYGITENIGRYFNEYNQAVNMQKVNDEVIAIEHDIRNQISLAADFSKQNISWFEDEIDGIHRSPFMSKWLGAKLSSLGYKIVDSGNTFRVDTITRTGVVGKKSIPNITPKVFTLNMAFTNGLENSLSVIDNMQKSMPKKSVNSPSTTDIYRQFSELKETTGLVEEETESRSARNKLTIDDIHELRKENRNLIVVDHSSHLTQDSAVFVYYISDKFIGWLHDIGLDERSINKISDLVSNYILNERWSPNLAEVVLDVLVTKLLVANPTLNQYFD